MVSTRTCDFSGEEIEPGTGIMYVRNNGTVLHFKDRKAEKNYFMGREARDLEWTQAGQAAKEGRRPQELEAEPEPEPDVESEPGAEPESEPEPEVEAAEETTGTPDLEAAEDEGESSGAAEAETAAADATEEDEE
ncbi:MAG: 50S ribosomal protein L24e [Haloarculaceae archaeon]